MRVLPPGSVSAEFISLSGHVNCSNPFCTECGVFTKGIVMFAKIFFVCFEEKTVEVFFEHYLLPWEKKPAYMRSDYGRLCVCVCMCVCVCVCARTCAKLLQLYLTLCSPMDCTHQASLSMGFSRQEYWSGLPCPPPGDLPNPGIKCAAPATPSLDFFTAEPPVKLSMEG